MIFIQVLVTTQLTRPRLVVVELYLPFCGLHVCKSARSFPYWGHLGVLGWCNEVPPFYSFGSSLVILCATSMKRQIMYMLWENQQTFKACAVVDDSRC